MEPWLLILLLVGAVDLLGRVITLLYLMQCSTVRRGSYRTWVLVVAFVNFAFLAYWCFAAQGKPSH